MSTLKLGKVVQAVGPIIDVRFKDEQLPELLTALEVVLSDTNKLTIEVAQHIGDDVVRCIAMSNTDGLVRNMEAVDTGAAIKVPVGKEILGRMFNVLGEPIDGLGDISKDIKKMPIQSK